MPSTRFLSGVAFAIAIAACSSGSAPLAQQHAFERDPSTASGDSTGCAICGGRLHCIGTFEGVPVDVVVATSSSKNGECKASGLRLRCDGQVVGVGSTQNGGDTKGETVTTLGTWTSLGEGFVLCAKGDCIVCTPTDAPLTEQPPPDPQPQPGGGRDSGAGVPDAG